MRSTTILISILAVTLRRRRSSRAWAADGLRDARAVTCHGLWQLNKSAPRPSACHRDGDQQHCRDDDHHEREVRRSDRPLCRGVSDVLHLGLLPAPHAMWPRCPGHRGSPPIHLRGTPDAAVVLGCHDRRVATKVLIVDDHAGFRTRARSLLAAAGYDVVGEAEDGRSALVAVDELGPDIVLLDVQLPDTTGFDLVVSLRRDPDPPAVILVSSREASDYGGRIISSGARGFVSKSELSAAALTRIIESSP